MTPQDSKHDGVRSSAPSPSSRGADTAAAAPLRAPSFAHVSQLAELIAETRQYPHGVSRADLGETLTLGRNAVDRRLKTAVGLGLLSPAGRGMSTGGRAPEMWRFNPSAATILVLSISYRSSTVALTDLGGTIIDQASWDEGILSAPQTVTSHALEHLNALRSRHPELPPAWGLGVCVPTAVDFRDGTLIAPATARTGGASDTLHWTGFPLRSRLAQQLDLPVWLDDEVNVMALAAATRIGAPQDLLYVRLSLGLGMGIVSQGKIHRGAAAASGEIAHIQMAGSGGRACRCGRKGCLETTLSGGAMEDAATTPQALKRSPYLRHLDESGGIRCEHVFRGAAEGDPVCVRLLTEAADRLSVVLAVLTTTYNPGEVVLGGGVAQAGEFFSRAVNQALRRRVLPATSERLRVRMGMEDDALKGACRMVTDRLLSAHVMHVWLPHGSPVGVAELVTHRRQDA
ncbi:ROK family protein [Actinomyces sp. MRS3W]|uniref:ROK family protein n=1 Tax=Actinomyces sp. MRS3W TaxID=2800796 RepID=UPI0028FDC33C|nr:ROK family protein [Actinomyces sp. MRS3W]MDU0347969.1 ROK family protein [Actinomyces sp. MRS3W]